MNVDNFVRSREQSWVELATLVARAGGRPDRLGPDGVRRLGVLYRSAAADLALARRRFQVEPVCARLERLVDDARVAVYERARHRDQIAQFLSTGYWRRVRERPRLLLATAVILFGMWGLSMAWALDDPDTASRFVPETRGWTAPEIERAEDRGGVAAMIFTNNIQVAFIAFVGGLTAGLGTVALLAWNGVALGLTSGLAIVDGTGGDLLEWIAAHGFLELSCIVVAGAAGLRLGGALLVPGHRKRSTAFVEEARAAIEVVVGTALSLVVAGLVEGFVSPAWLGLGPVLVIGLLLGGTYWGLVIVRGRPEPPDPDAVPGPRLAVGFR